MKFVVSFDVLVAVRCQLRFRDGQYVKAENSIDTGILYSSTVISVCVLLIPVLCNRTDGGSPVGGWLMEFQHFVGWFIVAKPRWNRGFGHCNTSKPHFPFQAPLYNL